MSAVPADSWHRPVMSAEVLQYLQPRPGGIIVDGTVGTGGHSLAILPHLRPDGTLIAVDQDRDALALAAKRLTDFAPQVTFRHGNFRSLPLLLDELGLAKVDGVVLDLGMSSLQVDRPERGFSFSSAGPLDMRMDATQDTTAAALVNELSADELATILRTLGEERFARRIAQRIVQARQAHPLETTTQLAEVVSRAVPASARHGRLHPATRTFQALRMAVNDELGALEELLNTLGECVNPGARVIFITFHSLEDRLVKHALAQGAREGRWRVLTKKPVRPSDAEVARNPRARSAKLRAAEALDGAGGGS